MAITYLYNEGVGEDDWVEGYMKPWQGYLDKETDKLYLYADPFDTPPGEAAVVTDAAVDLTAYDTLKVDWQVVDAGTAGYLDLIASSNKMSDRTVYDARFSLDASSTCSRRVDSLDVSGLSGNYYVRVHAYATVDVETVAGEIYKVWLESASVIIDASASLLGSGLSEGSSNVLVEGAGVSTGRGLLSSSSPGVVIGASSPLGGKGRFAAQSPLLVLKASALLAGNGFLAGSPTLLMEGGSRLSGVGDMQGSGGVIIQGASGISASGALSADSALVLIGSAGLAGHGVLQGSSCVLVEAESAFNGSGLLSAVAVVSTSYSQDVGDGTVSISGSLSVSAGYVRSFGGTLTPSGTATLAANYLQSVGGGDIAPSGDLIKRTYKVLSGLLAPEGSLAKATSISASATLAPAGDLGTAYGGFVDAGGGTLTPSGILTTQGQFSVVVEVALALAGSLSRWVGKALSCSLTPQGELTKESAKNVGDGQLTPTGEWGLQSNANPGGVITMGGTLELKLIKAVPSEIKRLNRLKYSEKDEMKR